MEKPYWLQDCEHGERFEYCEHELPGDEEIEIITEALDVIVESVQQGSVETGYTTCPELKATMRNFDYHFPVTSEHDVYGIRETIDIERVDTHEPPEGGRTYTIVSSWQTTGPDSPRTIVERTYTIELYCDDRSRYTVNEMDLWPDQSQSGGAIGYTDRPMVGYDLTELAKLLHRIQDVELADRKFVDPDSYLGWSQSE